MHDRYPGVVNGIVHEVDQKLGRVKVEFPWLQQSYVSNWAPIASTMAGKERGLYQMPEVGDEALVAFDQGHFEHPFIVGFLWNGVDVPPHKDIDASVRRLRSVSGHTFDMDDRKDKEKVIVKSKGGHTITLDDTKDASNIEVRTNGGLVIRMDDKTGTITVEAKQKVEVHAPAIDLGKGAVEQAVLGNRLQTFLETFVTAFNSHLHVGQMAAGIIPVTPMKPAAPQAAPSGLLSDVVKEK